MGFIIAFYYIDSFKKGTQIFSCDVTRNSYYPDEDSYKIHVKQRNTTTSCGLSAAAPKAYEIQPPVRVSYFRPPVRIAREAPMLNRPPISY
ncbi:hypothetical protein HW555_005781 [Spodoptera exigua]|uniref:Uncharacterized protein n=1 Tax=Spodoptera exigua TaxID=7107 RepID=A0A835GJ55_SPOEX|nr:hypothetical protein HW555_005781 [Spodoptera exigua]